MYRTVNVVMTASAPNFRRVLSTAALEYDYFQRKVEGGNKRMAASSLTLGKAFATAGMGVAIGLGYGIVKAIEFDKQMRNVNSLLHESSSNFQAARNAVIGLSTRMPQRAKELSDGLYDIASAGYHGREALQLLEVSAREASAGLSTTKTASTATIQVLRSYGKGVNEAADVSDILFQTVYRGIFTYDNLAHSLNNVVGTAAAMKIPFDQVGSAMATMSLHGASAANASINLNQIIRAFLKPSEAMGDMLERLGFESGQAAIQQLTLRGVMMKIYQATGGNATALQKLFPEIRATRGAYQLLSDGGKDWASVAADIENKQRRAGATQRAFNEQQKSAAFQLKLLKNNVDALAISIGTALLPALIDIAKSVSGFVEGMRKGTGAGGTFVDILKRAWQAAQPLVGALKNVAQFALGLASDLAPLVSVLAQLAGTVAGASLYAVGVALQTLTSFAAENRTAVLALAAAWALWRAGGLVGIAVKLMEIGAVLGAMPARFAAAATGARAFAAGLTAVKIAEAGATLGLSILAAVAVEQWAKHATAAKNASREIEQAVRNSQTSSRVQIQQSLDTLRKQVDYWRANAKQDLDIWNLFSDRKGRLKEAEAALAKVSQRSKNLEANIQTLRNIYSLSDSSVIALANRFKINLSGAMDQVIPKFQDHYLQLQNRVTPAQQNLSEALSRASGSAKSLAEQIKGLVDSLEALTQPQLDANAATRAFYAALDAVKARIPQARAGITALTEAGRANQEAIDDAAGKLIKYATTQLNTVGPSEQLRAKVLAQRTALINQAAAFFGSRKRAEEYINKLGLTTQALGLTKGATDRESAALATYAARTLHATGRTSGYWKEVQTLNQRIKELRDRVVKVSTSGVPGAKGQIKSLYAQINAQKDKIWRITLAAGATPGSPAQFRLREGFEPRARGGPIYGSGSGDSVPAMLTPGEHVWTTAEVAKAGGHRAMYAMRKAVRGYADGGAVAVKGVMNFPSAPIFATINRFKTLLSQAMSAYMRQWLSAFGEGPTGIPANVRGNAAIVRSLAASMYGWVGAQWSALYRLVMNESGFRNTAQNPTSTAYGMFQFLNSTWAGYGVRKTSDPRMQAIAGLRYIRSRYGSPVAALAAWQSRSPHWYDQGGWLPPGVSLAYNGTGRPERVIPPGQSGGIYINEGAVKVVVQVSSPHVTPADVRAITGDTVDKALDKLARRLTAGGRR